MLVAWSRSSGSLQPQTWPTRLLPPAPCTPTPLSGAPLSGLHHHSQVWIGLIPVITCATTNEGMPVLKYIEKLA